MKISCATYCYHRESLREALKAIARLGFGAVEMWAGHADGTAGYDGRGDPQAAKGMAEDLGLLIEAYHVGALDEDERGHLVGAFEFAKGVGAGMVNGYVSPRVVDEIGDLCEEYDLRFGIENHWREALELPEDLLPVLERASERVGVNLDTGHFASAGCDPVEALQELGGRVVHVHLKDIREPGSHVSVAFGRGMARVADTLLELRARGYGGYACVEHEVDGDPTEALGESKAFLDGILGREAEG